MKKVIIALAILFAFPCSASNILEGAIIKSPSSPDVYIVKYNAGKQYKRLVLNPLVFKSYGHLKWENLLTISDGEMNSFITSDLVRVDGSTDIYQLVPEGDNGGRYQLTSTSGYDLNSIYTVNSTDFGNYSAKGARGAKTVNSSDYNKTENAVTKTDNSAELAAAKAELARKRKVSSAYDKITDIVNDINDDMDTLSDQIDAKQKEIDKLTGSGASQSYVDGKRSILIPQYNALVNKYNALSEKKTRISTIVYELQDYADYGTVIPSADRVYLASLGIIL